MSDNFGWRALAVGLTLVSASACHDDKDKPQNDGGDADATPAVDTTPLTATELCHLWNAANDIFDVCTSTTQYDTAEDIDDCPSDSDGMTWGQGLLDSVSASRISLDWGLAHQCLQQAHVLRANNSPITLFTNADWVALTSDGGPCRSFYTPLVDTNGACVHDWDCKNATDDCTMATPYSASTLSCVPRATAGADCDGYFVECAAGAHCDTSSDKCVADTALGASCTTNDECGDDAYCNSVCTQAEVVDLGGACTAAADCKGECTVCSQGPGESSKTCKLLGGANAVCSTDDDCADDLGCTNGVCATVGAGAPCGGSNGGVCNNDLSCQPVVDCSAQETQADCNLLAPYCTFNGSCRTDVGACTKLPASGACLPEYTNRCAQEAYCVPADNQCHVLGRAGDVCDSNRELANQCDVGFDCVNNVCVASCYSAVCPDGQYCDESVPPSQCKPFMTDNCVGQSNECGPDAFCLAAAIKCAMHADEPTCATDTECNFSGTCVPNDGVVNHCRPLGEAGDLVLTPCSTGGGEPAYYGFSSSCKSTACNPTTNTCIPQALSQGCLSTTLDSIGQTFAFGMVVLCWPRRRRRKD